MKLRSVRAASVAVLAACFAPAPAAAQHCWSASVAVALRDERGARIEPARLDSVRFTPRGAPFDMGRLGAYFVTYDTALARLPVLLWTGGGACRVRLDEVVIHFRGREMRLYPDILVDAAANPGPNDFLLDPVRFRPGCWAREPGPFPAGRAHKRVVFAPRWRRSPCAPRTQAPPGSHGKEHS
ncbi:MAG TPA: hypothetical protein VE913_23150 [Longimicrobium sp.]|nr:hypothetical protein [Longimicrobium sp.]